MEIYMQPWVAYCGRRYDSPALVAMLVEYTRAVICQACDELELLPTNENLERIAAQCARNTEVQC